jgi:hypothetical protein
MKLKIMFILVVSVLILSGCEGRKMPSQVCDYCNGSIYYHIVSESAHGSGAYQLESLSDETSRFHPWCNKIRLLEIKVGLLEEVIENGY